MNLFSVGTKVFAVLLLIFANFIFVPSQDDSIYRIKAGTKILLRMDSEINSKVASTGDTFTATSVNPVSVRGSVTLTTGTVFEGRVVKVCTSSSGGQNGELQLAFVTMRLDRGQERQIDGVLVNNLKAGSARTFSAISILGGTIVGAVFGSLLKADSGLLVGAATGAGVGTTIALLRKGKNVRIKSGEEFEIELKKDVILPVLDY